MIMNLHRLIDCGSRKIGLFVAVLLSLFSVHSYAQTASPKVVFKTNLEVGQSITFGAKAKGSLTIKGVTGAQWNPSGDDVTYEVGEGQTITLEGDVTHLYLNDAKVTEFDATSALSLSYLSVERNELKALDVSNNEKLEYLYARDNQITDMLLCSGGKIFRVYCSLNQLKGDKMEKLIESLPDYTTSPNPGLLAIADLSQPDKEGNVCSKTLVQEALSRRWRVQAFNGTQFVAYEGVDDGGSGNQKEKIVLRTLKAKGATITMKISANGEVKAQGLTESIVPNAQNTYTLSSQEIVLEGEITGLEAPNCELINLNVRNAKNLQEINCSNNPLKRLNFSENKLLRTLQCADNSLVELNLANNVALEELNCSNNSLKQLDLTSNVKLRKINCSNNGIKGVDADVLVNSIVDRSAMGARGELIAVSLQKDNNNIYKHHVTQLNSRGWDVKALNGTELQPYEGKEQPYLSFVTSRNVGEKIKLKIKSENNVTVEGLEGTWINDQQVEYTILSQKITLRGDIYFLHCYSNGVTEMDFSHADFIQKIDCSDNFIDKDHMTKLIASLPNRVGIEPMGEITVRDTTKEKENNVCTQQQCYEARQRGWQTMKYSSGTGYSKYEGDDEFDIPSTNNIIKFKTDRPVGSTVTIEVKVKDPSSQVTVIGLNGTFDTDIEVVYEIEEQEFSFQGDITSLRCVGNDITAIDLSDSHSLKLLNCSRNKITELNLSNQRFLETLFCQDNRIEKLNFSGNPKLEWVNCHENNIKEEGFKEIANTIVSRFYFEEPGSIIFFNAYDASSPDKNVASAEDVATLKEKKWAVRKIVGKEGMLYVFEDYLFSSDITRPSFSYYVDRNNRTLVLTGMQSVDAIALFDMNGRLIEMSHSNFDGKASIDVQALPSGCYVVKVGKESRVIIL